MKLDHKVIKEALATGSGHMYTLSGIAVDYKDFSNTIIDLMDIARGLAGANRFFGHTHQRFTVLEHSLIGSRLAETPELKFEALLHDAAEAYMGDMVAPLKAFFSEFKTLEARIAGHIFDFYWPGNTLVKDGMYTRSDDMLALDEMMYICENQQFRNNLVGQPSLPKEYHDEWFNQYMHVRNHMYEISPVDLFMLAFEDAQHNALPNLYDDVAYG